MERAPLRPVPRRVDGPVDPDQAIAFVGERLPGLDERAQSALALVELVRRDRGSLDLDADAAAEALARGRKALRRSLYPLPGSGWCERAERLISDRMDGELAAPGPARLDAHLANCPRCVEHDLRLAQSIDTLVAGFIEEHPAPPPPRAAPEPEAAEPEPAEPEHPAEPEPVVEPEPPELTVVEPAPEPVPEAQPLAAAPEPEPQPTSAAGASLGLAWKAMYALAVVFAVLALVLTALGIAGVDPL